MKSWKEWQESESKEVQEWVLGRKGPVMTRTSIEQS